MVQNFPRKKKFTETALKEIDSGNQETLFSFPLNCMELAASIKKFGLFHPVCLAGSNGSGPLVPICGHRRLHAFSELGYETIPSFILEIEQWDALEALLFNVSENSAHRSLNDIERSNILAKLSEGNFPEERIMEEAMPLIGLDRSKRALEDYLALQSLVPQFKAYLLEIAVPLRIAARLARWGEEDQLSLYSVAATFRPGGSKLKEILDLAEEIGLREGILPGSVLRADEVVFVCGSKELAPSDKAKRIHACLWSKRYPLLSEKREAIKREIKGLPLPKGIEIHYPENLEREELTLSLRFSNSKELISGLDAIKYRWEQEKVERIFGMLRE